MFRRLFSLFLIAGLALVPQALLEAQSATASSPIPLSPLVDGKIYAKVYPNYDALRRGSEMKMAVVPLRHGHSPYSGQLPIFLRSASSLAPESVSTRLEFDPVEGLSLGAVEPPSFESKEIPVFQPAG